MRLFLVLATCVAISACGFRPLYAGGDAGVSTSNFSIQIAEIPGRSGYQLRQALLRDLGYGLPGVDDSAILTVTIREQVERATLQPDGAVSRSFYNASGFYALETDGRVIKGEAQASVPFAANSSPYSDVSAQTNAAERAMQELSRRLVDQLRIQAQDAQ